MIEVIYKFLNNEIIVQDFENFIYQNPALESELGEIVYQNLIELDYKSRHIFSEIQKYFFEDLNWEEKFKEWKVRKILESNSIVLSEDNLYSVVSNNQFFFNSVEEIIETHYFLNKSIEIVWNDKAIAQEIKFNPQEESKNVFKIGYFENGYVDIIVNQQGEIWFFTIVDEKLYFGGDNLLEAFSKLIFEIYYK